MWGTCPQKEAEATSLGFFNTERKTVNGKRC